MVQKFAKEAGVEFEVPENFNALLAAHHSKTAPKKVEEKARFELPDTVLRFYEDEYKQEFEAKILYSKNKQIILDETYYYPEGGGQPGDLGTLTVGDKTVNIADIQKSAGVVVHNVSEDSLNNVPENTTVVCKIDWPRRVQLMRNHTATHVVNGAARALLGGHIWQTGAQKGLDRSRLDITHYAKLTHEELQKIELIANETVLQGYPVDKAWLPRDKAEKEYGFRLYQGGVPPGKSVRVVNIEGFDVEACAGTHLDNTREIGMIKLLRSERIQDGVERLEFAVGLEAIKQNQARDKLLSTSSAVFNVRPEQLPKTAERFFEEWKAQRKEIQELHTGGSIKSTTGDLEEEKIGDISFIEVETNQPLKSVKAIVRKSLKDSSKTVASFGTVEEGAGKHIIARTNDIDLDMREVIKESAKTLGGGFGGKPDFAQAGGPNGDKLKEAMKKAREQIEKLKKQKR
jgi:alanyl-tRNA synthetase